MLYWLEKLWAAIEKWLKPDPTPPPPEPPPPPGPPPEPPRVDRLWDPASTQGVSAFALTLCDKAYIRDFTQYVHDHGYTVLRVGAQTDGWQGFRAGYLRPGPPVYTPEWRENLHRMLDTTARIPDTWVQLIPTFTHKQKGGPDYQRKLCEAVCDVVVEGGYRHVFWEVMNEFKHLLRHKEIGDGDIADIGRELYDRTGFPVSSDHPGKTTPEGEWKGYFPVAWRHFHYFAYHPPRNPDPHRLEYRQAIARWPRKYILFDETTCYASDAQIDRYGLKGRGTVALMGRGTEHERQAVIHDQKNKIKLASQAEGGRGRWFYHSIWGIECRGELGTADTWIPGY